MSKTIKKSNGEKIFDVFNIVLMILLIIIMLYPIWFVAVASLSSDMEIRKAGALMLWPKGVTFNAYKAVLSNGSIWLGYKNTIFYVVFGTFLNVIMTILAGYGLSRKWLYGKNVLMFGITLTMFISGGLIPTFLLVNSIGLYDTRWAMILPGACAVYNIIITRTFFLNIPDSLEESARIDGANDYMILFKIMVPLSKAIIAVNVLWYAVGHWNAWFNATIFLRDASKFPLQIFLRQLLIQADSSNMGESEFEELGQNVKHAVIMVATLPILCVYPFLQKHFVGGVMIGAIKG